MKEVKQINNWIIKENGMGLYCIYSPLKKCMEDNLTLEQAESFCKENLDYISKRNK
jgi:hypothetical protein